MTKKRERPWAKYARVDRVELKNGDVKFRTRAVLSNYKGVEHIATPDEEEHFEDLNSALDHLDMWWETKWKPWDAVQVKSEKRA